MGHWFASFYFNKFLVYLMILLVVFGVIVLTSSSYDLTTKEGRSAFVKGYFGFMGNLVKNSANTVSYAIKLDWVPDNS